MNNIILEWKQIDINSIPELDDTYFYAFTQNNNLLYIGMTYYQDVVDEIRQTIRRIGYNGNKIWLGYIKKTDYERITKEIIMDIEFLLI
jgi:hypothetical protein